MYRVYLRSADGATMGVVTHARTREDAAQAFAALVNDTAYDGFELAAVLVEDKRPIAVHRFDQPNGSAHDWRGRLRQLPFSPLH